MKNITGIDEVEGARLYVKWTTNVGISVYAYIELGASILQAVGKAEEWELWMRFDSQDALSDFQEYCDEKVPLLS